MEQFLGIPVKWALNIIDYRTVMAGLYKRDNRADLENVAREAFKYRADDCQCEDYGAEDYLYLLELVLDNRGSVVQVLDGECQDGEAYRDENGDVIFLYKELRFENKEQLMLWAVGVLVSLGVYAMDDAV